MQTIKENKLTYKFVELCFNDIHEIQLYTPCYINEKNKHIYTIPIPCENLKICNNIELKNIFDFNALTNKSGIYWIVSNAPINHCFNSGVRCPNKNTEDMRIIYNGSAINIRKRIKEHLLRSDEKCGSGSQSGISIDILLDTMDNDKISHIKCLWGNKKKIPKICKNNEIINIIDKDELTEILYLTKKEKNYIKKTKTIYFKNGINILSNKHKKYSWIVYFLEINNHNIRDYIEIEWRKKYGVPILCSYTSGR